MNMIDTINLVWAFFVIFSLVFLGSYKKPSLHMSTELNCQHTNCYCIISRGNSCRITVAILTWWAVGILHAFSQMVAYIYIYIWYIYTYIYRERFLCNRQREFFLCYIFDRLYKEKTKHNHSTWVQKCPPTYKRFF